MRSKVSRVIERTLIELYRAAVPYVDLTPYLQKEKPAEKIDYNNHWLPREVQVGIESRICVEYNLKEYERQQVHTSLILGASPNTCYRQWFINMLRQKAKNTDFYKQFKKQIDDALEWGIYSGEFI